MTVKDALHTAGGVVDAADARLAQAGLLAAGGANSSDTRTGVLDGPSSNNVLRGTSSTSPMRIRVGDHHWISSKGAANGAYLGANYGNVDLPLAAAPASQARIDVVYVMQKDAFATSGADTTTAPELGVIRGKAASSPVAPLSDGQQETGTPALPGTATVLGTVRIPAGVTSTLDAGVVITNTAPITSARGAPIPVRSQAERDALTLWDGLHVKRLDAGGVLEGWGAGTWRRYELADDTGWTYWNDATAANALSIGGAWDLVAAYPLRFRRRGGQVHVQGMVQWVTGQYASNIAGLPAGFRPAENTVLCSGLTGNGTTKGNYDVFVLPDGSIFMNTIYQDNAPSVGSTVPIFGSFLIG